MLVQKGVSPLSSMYLFENQFFENTPPKSSGKTLPKKPYENGKITISTYKEVSLFPYHRIRKLEILC